VAPPPSDIDSRLRRAWGRHAIVGLLGHRARITFYRQLHALVKSGQGIPTSLAKLARHAPDARTRRAMEQMQRDVAAGATMGEAMRKHADKFGDAIVGLVLFAEDAGKLQEVLEKVIANEEELQSLRWKTLFASLYPFYLLIIAVFVGPLLGLARSASSIGGNWIGAYLDGLGHNLVLAMFAAAIILGAPFLVAAAGLDGALERVVLAIPGAGRVKRDFIGSRFFLALGLGMDAGVEVKRAVRIATHASASPSMIADLSETLDRLGRGSSLADALDPLAGLDRLSLGAIAMGEDTGTLVEQLERLSRDAQVAAIRGAKVLMIVVFAAIVIVLLAGLVFNALGIVFGPIRELYTLPAEV